MELGYTKATAAADLWTTIAKEPVIVEEIGGAVYGFCSEIAALRLFHKYNTVTNNGRAKAKYSEPRKSWYFCLESAA